MKVQLYMQASTLMVKGEKYKGQHVVACVDAAITTDEVAICATTDNIWPFRSMNIDSKALHLFKSNGERSFYVNKDTKGTDKGVFSWFVRY